MTVAESTTITFAKQVLEIAPSSLTATDREQLLAVERRR